MEKQPSRRLHNHHHCSCCYCWANNYYCNNKFDEHPVPAAAPAIIVAVAIVQVVAVAEKARYQSC